MALTLVMTLLDYDYSYIESSESIYDMNDLVMMIHPNIQPSYYAYFFWQQKICK